MANVHVCREHNDYLFGIGMKEAVRRAIAAIDRLRTNFETQAKLGLGGVMDDMVTTADTTAQAVYVNVLSQGFPNWGIVAEEDGLTVACRMEGADSYFTVDPLDGTKAFARGQTDGVGTMISAVVDGHVAAAFVGDVMSSEIFGFRLNSQVVHRIGDFDTTERLKIDPHRTLAGQSIMLRRGRDLCSPLLRKFLRSSAESHREVEFVSGSIGLSFARLWQGKVGGAVLERGMTTPWDLSPIVGISEKLGFVFLRCEENDFVPYRPIISKHIEHVDFDTLIVHESRVGELREALRRIKA